MINTTTRFRQALYDGNRNYIETIQITLTDGTVLNLTNEDVWQCSMSFEDAVSSDSDFQIGAAIINKQKLRLNNMYEDFNDYAFEGAQVITNIGLACGTNGEVERLRKGTFVVDTADYDETIISLDLLDYMSKFEKPFSDVNITFPVQAQTLVNRICNHCGVTLGTVDFPHRNFTLDSGPEKETCSCREVIAWVAQICGCFARCDTQGRLELKWYDTNALDSFLDGLDGGVFDKTTSSRYQTGDTANGGSFNPWNTGYVYDDGDFTQVLKNVHVISETFSHKISADDVVITGVRILVKTNSDSGSGSEIVSYMEGTVGYVVEISNNELITESNVDEILGWLGVQLIGLTFRKANVSIPSDPSIEAGDVGIIFDRKGNNYPILISRTTFTPFGQQTVISSAQTPARNSAARYSAETKNYVELRKQVKEQMTTWELAEKALREAIANANGLYTTDVTDPSTGATIHYLHNKGPDGTATDKSGLNASDIRIMISDVGITMTANGTDPNPTWYGMTVDGRMIASIMSTIGLDFDWGTGGTLTLGGVNNENGLLVMLNSANNEIGRWSNSGIDIDKGSINLGNGKFIVDNNGNVYIYKGSIDIGNGQFDVDSSGNVTAKSLVADDYVYVDGDNNSYIKIPYTAYSSSGYTEISSAGLKTSFSGGAVQIGTLKTWSSGYGTQYPSGTSAIPNVLLTQGNASSEAWRNDVFCSGIELTKVAYNEAVRNLWLSSYKIELNQANGYSTGSFAFRASCADKTVAIDGDLSVTGAKNRLVRTEDYSDRLLYCYETPTPMFGDIGEGEIGEDGLCYVAIDPVFSETITVAQYQVSLQKYGEGDCYVKERTGNYFVVKGTPGLPFGWELKAKQSGYEQRRLDDINFVKPQQEERIDYGGLAVEHIDEVNSERMVA